MATDTSSIFYKIGQATANATSSATDNLKGAAKEYLNHNEYRKGKAKGATDAQRAISRRMLENARDLDPNVKA